MKLLITGTKGFIGKALYKSLRDDYDVRVFNETDIQYNWREILEEIVKNTDCIFHIGAISSTTETDVNRVMELNYEFSKYLFDCANKYNKPVIFSSSAAIYGKNMEEDRPRNIYGWSKKLCEDYGLTTLKKFIALRYFNVYGPGESFKGKSASVAYQAFVHSKTSGEPFPLFAGGPQRDFVFIDDVISANKFALLNIDKIKNGTYDVGSGVESPFEAVLNELGVKYKYPRDMYTPHWYQYFTLANEEKFLPGWKPRYTLQAGMFLYRKFLETNYNAPVARID